jgi:hypothetical protein
MTCTMIRGMSRLEYHDLVRRSIPASVAVFALLAFPFLFVSSSQAEGQFSPSPTGAVHPPTGAVAPMTGAVRPPTSTVPGQNFFGPGGTFPNSPSGFSGSRRGEHNGQHGHHRRQLGEYGYVPYAVAIPYAPDYVAPDQDADDDSDYQGGPTIFDRRGYGAESYVPPVEDGLSPHADDAASSNTVADEEPQPETILVFKDGHKLEVRNYAILGDTLFDLTPGHPRKIALASLDLDATRQQNDDRGVVFQLPGASQGS